MTASALIRALEEGVVQEGKGGLGEWLAGVFKSRSGSAVGPGRVQNEHPITCRLLSIRAANRSLGACYRGNPDLTESEEP